MLLTVIEQETEIDPTEAAVATSIVKALRKYGPLRQRDLWYRSAGYRVGRDAFQRIVDSLVTQKTIVRLATHRKNSFILRMAPPKRRREKAMAREQAALEKGE